VEATNVLGKAVEPYGQLLIAPNQGSCPYTLFTIFMQGFRSSTGQWESIHHGRQLNFWDEGICVGTRHAKTLPATHGYSKVRVAVRGEYGEQHPRLGPSLLPVTAGVILR
jgi:hypothetical protein